MDTRAIASEYRMGHWATIIQAQKSSGQSIKGYCEEIGIRANVFFYWQRKLREAVATEYASRNTEQTLVPQGWSVCTAKEAPSKPSLSLSIEIGDYRVVVASDVDTELLSKVCRTLKQLC